MSVCTCVRKPVRLGCLKYSVDKRMEVSKKGRKATRRACVEKKEEEKNVVIAKQLPPRA